MSKPTKLILSTILALSAMVIGVILVVSFLVTAIIDVAQIICHEWLRAMFKTFKSLEESFKYVRKSKPDTTGTIEPATSRVH